MILKRCTNETCEHCEKPVRFAVWLELSTASADAWHIPGAVKQSDSQGCFLFHPKCAEIVLKKSFKAGL